MLRSSTFALLVLAAFAACTPGKSVPLAISRCDVLIDANGAARVTAHVTNDADRPMTSADLVLDLYRNYRFTRATGSVTFAPVLDPGAARDVRFPVAVPAGTSGAAMRCTATRAVFGDGTVDALGD